MTNEVKLQQRGFGNKAFDFISEGNVIDEAGGDEIHQRGNLMLRKSSSNFQKEGRHNIVLRGG